MGNKLIFLLLFLFLSSNVFANFFDPMTSRHLTVNGISPYVGINGGINTGPWKVKNAAGSGPSTNLPTGGKKVGMFAGLGGRICPGLYLAAELFANSGSTTSAYKVIDSTGTIGKVRSTYDYGLSFIPGYMFAPGTTLYARGGLIIANSIWIQNPAPDSLGRRSTQNTRLGAQFGFGLQSCFTPHWNIRIEYDYANYQNRFPFGNTLYAQNNQFNAGLFYKFF